MLIPLLAALVCVLCLLYDPPEVAPEDYYGPVDHMLLRFKAFYGLHIFWYRISWILLIILGVSAFSPGIMVGPLVLNGIRTASVQSLTAGIVLAQIGVASSMLLGFFGGYSIKLLYSKDAITIDNIGGTYRPMYR